MQTIRVALGTWQTKGAFKRDHSSVETRHPIFERVPTPNYVFADSHLFEVAEPRRIRAMLNGEDDYVAVCVLRYYICWNPSGLPWQLDDYGGGVSDDVKASSNQSLGRYREPRANLDCAAIRLSQHLD